MLTIENLTDLEGKVVFLRVDFNVPLTDGIIRDDNRIIQALPTIKYLQEQGCKLVILSHLGKIKHNDLPTKVAEQKRKNNMSFVYEKLKQILFFSDKKVLKRWGRNNKFLFCETCRGSDIKDKVNVMGDGDILLVQNTRFDKREETNDLTLAAEWAMIADVFVEDAFGSCHRAHASTFGLPSELIKEGKPVACGFLVQKEVASLSKCIRPSIEDRPYVAILGGLKVSDKIQVINSLIDKCDRIIIGGAMAYTFNKSLGKKIGTSPCEEFQLDYAKQCLRKAGGRIVLPVDAVCTDNFDRSERVIETDDDNIPEGFQGMDIGTKTRRLFADNIKKAKLIFWNGPMGVFEKAKFQAGTKSICEAVSKNPDCYSVCGGGDSAAAVAQFGFKDKFTHVSTGGGASLEMIENDGRLPGIEILKEPHEIDATFISGYLK